ncbi:LOW QUALITY PROTEIN: integrase, partial [Streptomyces viridosporus ATCC 14672]
WTCRVSTTLGPRSAGPSCRTAGSSTERRSPRPGCAPSPSWQNCSTRSRTTRSTSPLPAARGTSSPGRRAGSRGAAASATTVGQGPEGRGHHGRAALPRSAAHGPHPSLHGRGRHAGADDAQGAQQLPGRADPPAHDRRPGPGRRRPARGHDPRRRRRGLRPGTCHQPTSGAGNGLVAMVEADDAGPMPGQRKRRCQQQDEAQLTAARFAPDAGRWEVLFETRDEAEWHAHLRRLRASDTRIDWTATRADRLCGRL